jgi:Tc5 transposase DNA-binding domain
MIKQPLISAWVKDKDKWQVEWRKSGPGGGVPPTTKRACQTQHPDVTEMLELWVSKALADGVVLTGQVIRQKWTTFADLAHIPMDERLNLSDGWLARFKTRNNLKEMRRHGEAGSAKPQTVENERQRVQKILAEGHYNLKDIFNMDETGLFYACVLNCSYCPFVQH